MSQPNKRQKLDLEGIDPLRNVDSAAPSSAATYHVPSLQEASLVEAAPEQSGAIGWLA